LAAAEYNIILNYIIVKGAGDTCAYDHVIPLIVFTINGHTKQRRVQEQNKYIDNYSQQFYYYDIILGQNDK